MRRTPASRTRPRAPGTLDPLTGTGTVGACLERGLLQLWNQGQAGTTSMAGPAPWQLDPIKNHRDPKEKTIVLFVTDGDDTCGARGDSGGTDDDAKARRAAYYAERLYQPHRRHPARLVGPDLRHRLRRRLHRRRALPAQLDRVGRQRPRSGSHRAAGHHDDRRQLDRSGRVHQDASGPVHDVHGRVRGPRREHPRDAAPGDHRPGRLGRRLQRAAVDHRVGLRVRGPGSTGPDLRTAGCRSIAYAGRDPTALRVELHAARVQGSAPRPTRTTGSETPVQKWSAGDKLAEPGLRGDGHVQQHDRRRRPRRVRHVPAPRRGDRRLHRWARRPRSSAASTPRAGTASTPSARLR